MSRDPKWLAITFGIYAGVIAFWAGVAWLALWLIG